MANKKQSKTSTVNKKTSKTSMATYMRKRRESASDIGAIPAVVNPTRRAACQNDLHLFLTTYLREIFYRPVCAAEIQIIADIQAAMQNGGRKAIALPRGFGKSSLAVGSMLWAGLYGHRRFLVVVGATDSAASDILADAKAHLESNPLLIEDFPEVCYPVLKLDGRAQRCASQTCLGNRTKLEWKTDRITLPDTGGASAGVTLACAGITGSIRGMHKTDSKGKWVRPDFVLLDDPQTRESASEEKQTDKRERIILGDILGLAGHGKTIAGIMAITVIAKNDLADRFLNHKKHPEWRGQMESLVRTWASNENMWKEYQNLRTRELLGEVAAGSANDFYRQNQAAMDTGCSVLDPELYDHVSEISAIQHAYNLLADNGENAFLAEYQNTPVSLAPEAEYTLTADIIRSRLNGRKQFEVPPETVCTVVAIDINRYAAAYCVTSYNSQMTASIIDYGFWVPKGQKQLWNDNNQKEKAIYAAVLGVVSDLLQTKPYGKEISAMTVDAGFAAQTVYDAVSEARRQHKPIRIYASRGLSGDKYDLPRQTANIFKRGYMADVRKAYPAGLILYFDSHYWHMSTQRGWLGETGSPGGCSLFGKSPAKHSRFAEQASADKLQKTSIINGRTYATFFTNSQNEQGDCLAMCAALATIEGVSPTGQGRLTKRQKAKAAIALPEPLPDVSETVATEANQSTVSAEQPPSHPEQPAPIPARSTRRPIRIAGRGRSWASNW